MSIEKVALENSNEYHYVGDSYHTICGMNFWSWTAPLMKYQAVTSEAPPGKTLCPKCHRISVALWEEEEEYG